MLKFKDFLTRLYAYITSHKKTTLAFLLTFVSITYYVSGYFSGSESTNRYVLTRVEKGSLVVSVSGSGQVSNTSSSDIKSKVSGNITYLGVKNGQLVKAGYIVAQINAREALKAVRDAENSLASAKLSLEKLVQPSDSLTVLQAENAITSANDAKKKAQDDKLKAYEDGYNAVADAFLDLPNTVSGLQKILFNYDLNKGQDNISWYADQTDANSTERVRALQYKKEVYDAYQNARAVYLANLDAFNSTSRNDNNEKIEKIILYTYETVKIVSDSIKITKNYIDFVKDTMVLRNIAIPSAMTTHQVDLNSFTNNTNSSLSSLISVRNTIITSNDGISSADRTIAEKTENLKKIKSGADPLDVKSQELAVKQRENALSDAKSNLADYTIRTPYDGIITKTDVHRGEDVSSGGVIASLISNERIAEITLNEVDVAKVKNDQRVTLTFDAIPDFTVAGRVAEIDVAGTVNQGVVSYTVKIIMETQDDRIKPGMSVSAGIIVEAKTDVLLVPNSAIKNQNESNYVEIPMSSGYEISVEDIGNRSGVDLPEGLERRVVKVGSSNDTLTEIVSGLDINQVIISNTVKSSTTTSTTSQSQLRIPGLSTGGASRTR